MNILVIEGQQVPLLSNNLVQNLLIKPFLAKYPGAFRYWPMYWSDQAAIRPVDWDLIIGHSLGAHRALQLALTMKVDCRVLTLDPRWMDNGGILGAIPGGGYLENFPDFKAPLGMKVFNFYHKGPWLLGYQVTGAEWNVKLDCTHFNMPGRPEVFEVLEELVGVK